MYPFNFYLELNVMTANECDRCNSTTMTVPWAELQIL